MRAGITEDDYSELVGLIYDAVIEAQRWPAFLESFARAVQAQGTLIYTHNVDTAEASTEADAASPNAAVNFDPDYLRSLAEHYNMVNVWAQNEAVLKPGRPVTGSMLYPVSELPKTEFYNEWLHPQDFFHALGGIVVQDGPWAMKFSALRAKRAGDYTSDEIRLYQSLLPHLARAARLQRRLSFLQCLSSSSLAVLDEVPAGILLLDASGRILHANTAADAELRRADPLEGRINGELRSRGGIRSQRELAAVVAAAIDPSRGDADDLRMVAPFPRQNGQALFVQALPLSRRHNVAPVTIVSQRLAACALVIHSTAEPDSTLVPQLLRHVYGLTPAEIQVVLALAGGETLKQYAERRGISRNTATYQLKRAFDKTGIRRQSALVRWVLLKARSGAPPQTADGKEC